MIPDEEIIRQIKEGDIIAFNALFKDVYFQLYVHCRKFIPDAEEAKDRMQNVFLRFWEKRTEIDIHTSLKAYLYRSVQNECLNYLRSSRTPGYSDEKNPDRSRLEVADTYHTPDDELATLEIETITQQAIEQLPDQCKAIFILSRIERLKNQEIADQLGISVRTVDTQIYRALKVLKNRLKDYLNT